METQPKFSVCDRCKVKAAEFQCNDCLPGGVYCSNCITYLHSLPSKRNHNQTVLNNIPPQTFEINKSQPLNFDYQPQPTSVTQNYVNEIKSIYEGEKTQLQTRIDSLTTELCSTQKNLNERIDFLHKHIDETNQKHIKELEEVNRSYKAEIARLVNEKDTNIAKLSNALNEQKRINESLSFKLAEYENILNENNLVHKNEINKLSDDLVNLNNENFSLEKFFKDKIDQINAMHESEKNKIISTYEVAIEKMNQGYLHSKEKYTNLIQQREDYIKEIIDEHKKEVHELNLIIDKLKECNVSNKNDQEELIKMNETLKNTLEENHSELGKVKKELKKTVKEKNKANVAVKKLQDDIEGLKAANGKLNGIVYGRFGGVKNVK